MRDLRVLLSKSDLDHVVVRTRTYILFPQAYTQLYDTSVFVLCYFLSLNLDMICFLPQELIRLRCLLFRSE